MSHEHDVELFKNQSISNVCIRHSLIADPDFADLKCLSFSTQLDKFNRLSKLILITPEGTVIMFMLNGQWHTSFDIQSRRIITETQQASLIKKFSDFKPKFIQLFKSINLQPDITLTPTKIKELSESPTIKQDLLNLTHNYEEEANNIITNTIIWFLFNKPLLKDSQLESSIKNELLKILDDDFS